MGQHAASNAVERFEWEGRPMAYVIRAAFSPERTTFVTPSELQLQLGFIVYPAGSEIPRHVHQPVERHLRGTPEVLIVKSGLCWIDIYNDDRQIVATTQLHPGDTMLMVGGGHGFRMIENTVLVEIKQGPYPGVDEKVRF